MGQKQATFETFAIERSLKAAPARVFAAWRDIDAKKHWFIGPAEWSLIERTLDFRVGGRETLKGKLPDGTVTDFRAVYHDIVPDRRILFVYDMRLGETLISISMVTVELTPAGKGTHLLFTEQLVYLDGYEDPGARQRKEGEAKHLDRLAALLEREKA
jgi:uncharacterized protein YndB with AHSA1/START domain